MGNRIPVEVRNGQPVGTVPATDSKLMAAQGNPTHGVIHGAEVELLYLYGDVSRIIVSSPQDAHRLPGFTPD
jgi:hypothetical protein